MNKTSGISNAQVAYMMDNPENDKTGVWFIEAEKIRGIYLASK